MRTFAALTFASLSLAAQAPQVVLGAPDRKDLALTLFSEGVGLVQDRRQAVLPQGPCALVFEEVPDKLDPASVSLESLAPAGGLRVLTQDFQHRLLTPDTLLEALVGRTVKVATGDRIEEARLEAVDQGRAVLRFADRVEVDTGAVPRRILAPALPEGLQAHGRLQWTARTAAAGPHTLLARYLSGGLSWHADTTVSLDAPGTRARLATWVTLKNDTDLPFPGARVQLMTGKVQEEARAAWSSLSRVSPGALMDGLGVTPQAFAGRSLYTLDQPLDLGAHQSRQVQLFEVRDVPVRERLELRLDADQAGEPEAPAQPAARVVLLRNDAASGLGRRMPPGTARVFQADGGGLDQLLAVTPLTASLPGEDVELGLGPMEDLTAKALQTEQKVTGPRVQERTFEVRLRSDAAEARTATVIVAVPGDWALLGGSHPGKKAAAHELRFEVPVPAHGTALLRYRLRIRAPKADPS